MSDVPNDYYVKHSPDHLDAILVGFKGGVYVGGRVATKPVIKKAKRPSCSKLRITLIKRDGPLCHYCKCLMVMPNEYKIRDNTMTIEHVVPRSVGGTFRQDNIVLACNKCNHKFGDQQDKCDCGFCKQAVHNFNQRLDTARAVC